MNGEAGGNDFEYSQDEFRRMYAGASAKFLRWLEVSGQANNFDDDHARGGDSRGPEFQHIWDLWAKFNVKDALGLEGIDALKIGYGVREVNMSEEWNDSSKNIKTVERSAISNKIWPFDEEFSNPTGVWLEGKNGKLDWQVGVFSTTQDDWIAPWDDGQFYYLKLIYDFAETTGMDVSLEGRGVGRVSAAYCSDAGIGGGAAYHTFAVAFAPAIPVAIR